MIERRKMHNAASLGDSCLTEREQQNTGERGEHAKWPTTFMSVHLETQSHTPRARTTFENLCYHRLRPTCVRWVHRLSHQPFCSLAASMLSSYAATDLLVISVGKGAGLEDVVVVPAMEAGLAQVALAIPDL